MERPAEKWLALVILSFYAHLKGFTLFMLGHLEGARLICVKCCKIWFVLKSYAEFVCFCCCFPDSLKNKSKIENLEIAIFVSAVTVRFCGNGRQK